MKTIICTIVIVMASLSVYAQDTYRMWINQIDMPMNREGVLAHVLIDGLDGGRIDNLVFLFSGGFFLGGKDQDSIWANAVASASGFQDYLPGNVDSLKTNPLYKIYIVRKIEPPFGTSWQNWKDAVSIGADFCDGNNDGIYDPVDLNTNGVWDTNEDAPPLIGNEIAFCVYNDGVDPLLRNFNDVPPKGIEVRQTVFAFNKNYSTTPLDPLDYTIFVRYSLTNTGTVAEVLDSVYFGIWADTDLGDSEDDFAGCDTSAQSGFIYNYGDDIDFGINPPAHFSTFLQSPYAYIPGISFIDNNSNNNYDEGIDTPLDTANNYLGDLLGIKIIPGAKNLNMTSFIHYMHSHPTVGRPETKEEMYNYLRGRDRLGNYIDPCTWGYSIIAGGANCNEINPLFWYSGDPVSNYGWINDRQSDQLQVVSSGPFKLEVNKPVDIIAGHIVGRGTDALNSVTKAKDNAKTMINFVKSNFSDFTVSDIKDQITLQPEEFYLSQNYPNPFNPVTKIKYNIPSVISTEGRNLRVTLKVFDILGREITTLVNEEKPAGTYEVEFSASKFASGVYFYQLKAGNYMDTKKMILVK